MRKLHFEELSSVSAGYCNPDIERLTGECISIQCLIMQTVIDAHNFVSPNDIYWRPYCQF